MVGAFMLFCVFVINLLPNPHLIAAREIRDEIRLLRQAVERVAK